MAGVMLAVLASGLSAAWVWDGNATMVGAQLGSGGWLGSATWWTGDVTVVWADGNAAEIPAGATVTLAGSATASLLQVDGALTVGSGSLLRLGGSGLGTGRVQTNITNTSNLFQNGVQWLGPGDFTTTWQWAPSSPTGVQTVLGVRGANTTLRLAGPVDARGQALHLMIAQGARLVVAPEARINNQLVDWNARPVFFRGDGHPDNVVELAPGFVADLGGSATNPVGGLSVFRVGGATLVTHASASLPAIWKGAPPAQYHGGLKFDIDNGATWRVASTAQDWPGGTAWRFSWILDTQHDLRHTGRFQANLDDGWGPTATGTTLTKRGPARLRLQGDTAWQAGSVLRIEEGTVEVARDPWYTGPYPGATSALGNFLEVELHHAGGLKLEVPVGEVHHLRRLTAATNAAGMVELGAGQLAVAEGCLLSAGQTLGLELSATDAAPAVKLAASGSLSLPGRVVISGELPGAGRYRLLAGAAWSTPPTALPTLDWPDHSALVARLEVASEGAALDLVVETATGPAEGWAAWQAQHYGAEAIAAGRADPHQRAANGLSNLRNYALGRSPEAQIFPQGPRWQADGAAQSWQGRLPRPRADLDLSLWMGSQPTATEAVVVAESLGGQPWAARRESVSVEVAPDTGETTATVVAPVEPGAQFWGLEIRLRASLPNRP